MHDIRMVRDDPAGFDRGLARRGLAGQGADVHRADKRWRDATTAVQVTQARRKELSQEFGKLRAQGSEPPSSLKGELESLKNNAAGSDREVEEAAAALNKLLLTIPNLPAPDVPDGADEADNLEVKRWGEPRSFAFTPREHADFAGPLGLDFEGAAAMSGTRFVALRGQAARLHRALGQFMLDRQIANGFQEVAPPLLVREAALIGTGQLPKFADDLFRTTDDRWLIPTAEVSLTNLVRERILDEGELPLRFAALTPCFRAEAGAAGRDTRGLIRQHQFDKVEMVAITRPDASDEEQERMTACAEGVLEALGLAYRRVKLCTGDMGFTARRTYDLEVWLPGQGRYREISSVSTCGDFQARRMDARFRVAGEKGTRFVHTLNGSGLAVGRALVAVLETYQEADGSVSVPDALHPYTGGLTRLTPA